MKDRKQLIVTSPGWMDQDLAKLLFDEGFLVIQVPEGQSFKIVEPEVLFDSNEMLTDLLCAVRERSYTSEACQTFVQKLALRAKEKETKP